MKDDPTTHRTMISLTEVVWVTEAHKSPYHIKEWTVSLKAAEGPVEIPLGHGIIHPHPLSQPQGMHDFFKQMMQLLLT